jgi:hypothetical protein
MTVVYGPEDALYGTGEYGVARYGSVGPTKIVTGVSLVASTGTLEISAKANTTLPKAPTLNTLVGTPLYLADANTDVTGVQLFTQIGEVTVRSVNRVEVTGVSASFSVGDLTVEGGTGVTVITDSLNVLVKLGTVTPAVRVFVSGVNLTQSVGSVSPTGKASTTLSGLVLDAESGQVTPVGVNFNFQQFADSYSGQRVVYIPKSNVIPEVA